jgi:hypothetical protein
MTVLSTVTIAAISMLKYSDDLIDVSWKRVLYRRP